VAVAQHRTAAGALLNGVIESSAPLQITTLSTPHYPVALGASTRKKVSLTKLDERDAPRSPGSINKKRARRSGSTRASESCIQKYVALKQSSSEGE
jgi:hypothetical protein